MGELKGIGDAVTYLLIKAALSGILAMAVSEIARRSPSIGGLVASLPLISLMAIIWLWHDTADAERIATHAEATFWYVLPTLPMFLVLPVMLRTGFGFWITLAVCCALTIALYAAMMWLLSRFGFAMD